MNSNPHAGLPMHAMVLAAGRGERMRPLTDVTPKPLLTVRGRPLLQWHLESLAAAGFADVVINIAHLGDQIKSFAGNGERFGLRIRYSEEPAGALETAGGIATAEPWRNAKGQMLDSPFLVINADVWTDWPAVEAFSMRESMVQGLGLTPARCHLVLVANPVQHPQGDFSIQTSTARSQEASIASKPGPTSAPKAPMMTFGRVQPRSEQASLTFSGIGVYDRRMFEAITPGTRAPLAPLLHQAVADGACMGAFYPGQWSDVGTPERLEQLNRP